MTYNLPNDQGPDVIFNGEQLAAISSYRGNVPDRWTELVVYREEHGAYVVQSIGRSTWPNERDKFRATVCADEDAVLAELGTGSLAKGIYDILGFDCVIDLR